MPPKCKHFKEPGKITSLNSLYLSPTIFIEDSQKEIYDGDPDASNVMLAIAGTCERTKGDVVAVTKKCRRELCEKEGKDCPRKEV